LRGRAGVIRSQTVVVSHHRDQRMQTYGEIIGRRARPPSEPYSGISSAGAKQRQRDQRPGPVSAGRTTFSSVSSASGAC